MYQMSFTTDTRYCFFILAVKFVYWQVSGAKHCCWDVSRIHKEAFLCGFISENVFFNKDFFFEKGTGGLGILLKCSKHHCKDKHKKPSKKGNVPIKLDKAR